MSLWTACGKPLCSLRNELANQLLIGYGLVKTCHTYKAFHPNNQTISKVLSIVRNSSHNEDWYLQKTNSKEALFFSDKDQKGRGHVLTVTIRSPSSPQLSSHEVACSAGSLPQPWLWLWLWLSGWKALWAVQSAEACLCLSTFQQPELSTWGWTKG